MPALRHAFEKHMNSSFSICTHFLHKHRYFINEPRPRVDVETDPFYGLVNIIQAVYESGRKCFK